MIEAFGINPTRLFNAPLTELVAEYRKAFEDYYSTDQKERLYYGGMIGAIACWRFGPEAWGNAVQQWHKDHPKPGVPRFHQPKAAKQEVNLEDLGL